MDPFKATHVSHKQVEAYPIAAAEFQEGGSGKVGVQHPTRGYIVVPVPPRFLRNPGDVAEGDYLVRYEPTDEQPHGYLSYSPRAVFEAGYTVIERETDTSAGLDFGAALQALKAGERVCRAGWNGKGMWLAQTPGSTVPATAASRTGALLAYVDAEGVEEVQILPHIDMRGADGRLTIGWAPSQPDMQATDWMVISSEPVMAA